MAESCSGNGSKSGDGGKSGDQSRVDGIETESTNIDDQLTAGVTSNIGIRVLGSGADGGGHAVVAGSGGDWRAPAEQGRTPVVAKSGGPQISPLDPRSNVEYSVVTSLGSSGAGGSSSCGGGNGGPRAAHVEQVEFIPPVGSSDHEPIMSSNLAEFVGVASLAWLMKESLEVVEAVMVAREERLKEIALHNEEERFMAETYAPPEPHVSIPSGAESYLPLRSEYDAEQVLRDPDQHLFRTWAQNEAMEAGEERRSYRGRPQGEAAVIHFELERTKPEQITGLVPIEWAREAARLMLAMEKEFHKIASGTPLQLHDPPVAPAPVPTVQPQV
ncbi:hypothetical protein RHMOL_Rhmol02G0193200 [Rhododendron molle]|uniref:Uncharacterized protein n=1 Tax=Rhododendron molle TaxID=49168 RepID=A0ACC0PRP0_RHOML|nr:hypothetical protein RHMOL_Rhmol02G0193200 [Rhododendron molle]